MHPLIMTPSSMGSHSSPGHTQSSLHVPAYFSFSHILHLAFTMLLYTSSKPVTLLKYLHSSIHRQSPAIQHHRECGGPRARRSYPRYLSVCEQDEGFPILFALTPAKRLKEGSNRCAVIIHRLALVWSLSWLG